MSSDGITNPGTIRAARSIIRPLITNEKSPSVTKLIGIEMSIQSGLTVWLMIAMTTAVSNAIHVVPSTRESVLT